MVLPNQTHSQVSWDSIFQVPLVFKMHGIPKFPEIQFEIPWNFIGNSIGNLIFKEEVNDLMHQHMAVSVSFGITPGLVVSDITREWKWSPWRDPRSSAAYWGAEWWGKRSVFLSLLFFLRADFLTLLVKFLLCFTLFRYGLQCFTFRGITYYFDHMSCLKRKR